MRWRLIRRELDGRVPLIGFAGSPWTVATYMVEGGGSKSFGIIKRMMYESAAELHRLLEVLAAATVSYLNAQIAAGAQAVMLFDTWGGCSPRRSTPSSPCDYMARWSPALTREAEGRRVPSIVFTKGGRRVAGRARRDRLRCTSASTGPRGSRDGAAGGWGPSGAAGQSRSVGTLFAPAHILRAETIARASRASARAPDTSSIWGTGSRRTSIRSGWRCWSRRCGATPPCDAVQGVRVRARGSLRCGARRRPAGLAARNSSRRARRRILPTLVFGSSVPKVHVFRDLVAGQVARRTRSAPPP